MIPTRTTLSLSVVLLLSQSAWAQGGGVELFRQHDLPIQSEGGSAVLGLNDINGDGVGDYLLGAPQFSTTGFYQNGAAFLYSGVDGSFVRSFPGQPNSGLGTSMAELGDINADGVTDFIVGAPTESSLTFVANGGAHVFSGATGSILHTFAGEAFWDFFGTSVACSGDINFDGVPDIMVGAPGADYGFLSSGSVYYYSGSDGTFLRRDDGSQQGGLFGQTVAGGGDVNGDGFPDALVGAPGEGLSDQGTVYVMSARSGSTRYEIHGQSTDEMLGQAISFVGDINNDGSDDFVLGSEEVRHSSLGDRGLAFVYSGQTGALLYQLGDFPGTRDFGCSVAGTEDLDGDGVGDIVVGDSRAEFGPNNYYGGVWAFSGRTGAKLFSIFNGLPSRFGFGVGATSDLDGDGRGEILVGAPFAYSSGNPPGGAVYVYSFNPYMTTNAFSLSASQGGLIQLDLDFPTQHAGDSFAVLMSDQGPGSFQWGVEIPLSLTPLALASWQGQYPQPLSFGMHGVLDPFGNATAFTGLFASSPARLVGHSFYFAAIAMPAGGLPEATSIAIKVGIIP